MHMYGTGDNPHGGHGVHIVSMNKAGAEDDSSEVDRQAGGQRGRQKILTYSGILFIFLIALDTHKKLFHTSAEEVTLPCPAPAVYI